MYIDITYPVIYRKNWKFRWLSVKYNFIYQTLMIGQGEIFFKTNGNVLK